MLIEDISTITACYIIYILYREMRDFSSLFRRMWDAFNLQSIPFVVSDCTRSTRSLSDGDGNRWFLEGKTAGLHDGHQILILPGVQLVFAFNYRSLRKYHLASSPPSCPPPNIFLSFSAILRLLPFLSHSELEFRSSVAHLQSLGGNYLSLVTQR